MRAIELPDELAGFSEREKLALVLPFRGTLRFSTHEYRRYERGRAAVDVFVGYDDRLHRGQSLLSPKNAFPGRGWHVEARSRVELPGAPSAESVLAHCAGRLAEFKRPKQVIFRDALPRNARGKLDRGSLAEQWKRQFAAV